MASEKKREYRIHVVKDLVPNKLENTGTEHLEFFFQYLFSEMGLRLIRKTGVGPDSVQRKCPPPFFQVVRLGEVYPLNRGLT